MLAETHINIIKTTYERLPKVKQRLLNLELLIIGSVEPDIDQDYKDYKHDFENTGELIIDIINETISKVETKETLSYNIGIISHFLTDYCSSYHSNYINKKRGIIRHILYELEVDELVHKLNKHYTMLPYFKYFNTIYNDIKSFIDYEMQQDENPTRDIKYCYAINEQVINLVLDEYINNKNRKNSHN